LQVQPELGSRVEGLSEEPCSLRCDAAPTANQLVDPLNGNTEMLCECNLGATHGDEKLLEQNLARVSRSAMFGLHGYPL
jgi:hypothetical protein